MGLVHYYVSCYNNFTHNIETYEVPYDVYIYVKQLEMAHKYPEESGFYKKYPRLRPQNDQAS